MFRLMGVALAFVACTAIGLTKAREIRERKQLLLDFKDMVNHISTEISYFKEPLPQVFERLSAGDDRESRLLLRSCLTAYISKGIHLREIWKEAVEDVYAGSSLTKEDLAVMQSCGDFLGQSDFKGQEGHFALFHQQMDRQLAEAEENIQVKGKMYGKMGVSAGLVIAVVCI